MPPTLYRPPRRSRRHRRRAFSLVEVALALGIIGFALAGLLGAIPLAASIGRQSIAQGRAASVANTLFANFRAQPFSAVQYLDAASSGTSGTAAGPTLNLNTATTTDKATFYAYFDEVTTTAPTDDARRLHFVASPPTGVSAYQVVLRFNNQPTGTLTPYPMNSSGTLHAQANGIEASIVASDHLRTDPATGNLVPDNSQNVYHFSSVVANRTE